MLLGVDMLGEAETQRPQRLATRTQQGPWRDAQKGEANTDQLFNFQYSEATHGIQAPSSFASLPAVIV